VKDGRVSALIVRRIGGLLRRLAWADYQTRREVQRHGVNLVPINSYSVVPSLEEVDQSFEYVPGDPPYLGSGLFEDRRLQSLVERMLPYAAEFDPPRDGDPESCRRYFWANDQFSHSDAMGYYCLVRMLRPRTIVEVGAGFSTLVALEAVRGNGFGRVVCIDPSPRPFLAHHPELIVIRSRVQDLPMSFFEEHLEDGDFLFIDSTHTVKTGSDCVHLYLRVLPRLRHDVLVHAHDVFLPFGMPRAWLRDLQIYWTEQYLVLALLLDNPRARVLFASAYLESFHSGLLRELMADKWTIGGSSFWFEYAGAGRRARAEAR
jgi:hypothetical protein